MREIKVRVWYEAESKYYYFSLEEYMLSNEERQSELCPSYIGLQSEQYTGLRDKNGLKDIYEGDIISPEGEVIANIHEGKERSGINLAITAMGCKSWRNTEQEAIKRGCFYAQ